jgi:hypothetical protein
VKEAGIDLHQGSKAGDIIENLTDSWKVRVATRTVQDHLKCIPEMLERKRKDDLKRSPDTLE